MSKPEDIPQDVWEAACELAQGLYLHAEEDGIPYVPFDEYPVIARAIMVAKAEEREACAEEANGVDPQLIKGMSDGAVSVYCRSRVDAAAAIRKRSEA